MPATIRFAEPADAGQIAVIYAPFCEETAVSFETTAPGPGEMAERIAAVTACFPWLVMEEDGILLGYAYAAPHGKRAAYRWSVTVSVYVRSGHHRRGIGRRLYAALFELLRRQGVFKAFAAIAIPNEGSIGLHEAMGFVHAGTFRGAGYKLGAWRDLGWWQLDLLPEVADPPEPLGIRELPGVA